MKNLDGWIISILFIIFFILIGNYSIKNYNSEKEQKEQKQPSYFQGYFDGINEVLNYLSETDQLKDSVIIDMKILIDIEFDKENERIEELNNK